MATPEEMDRLREALKRDDVRVEIDEYRGHASLFPQVAADSARDAAAQNARGDRVARIIEKAREPSPDSARVEIGLNPDQVQELVDAGAAQL